MISKQNCTYLTYIYFGHMDLSTIVKYQSYPLLSKFSLHSFVFTWLKGPHKCSSSSHSYGAVFWEGDMSFGCVFQLFKDIQASGDLKAVLRVIKLLRIHPLGKWGKHDFKKNFQDLSKYLIFFIMHSSFLGNFLAFFSLNNMNFLFRGIQNSVHSIFFYIKWSYYQSLCILSCLIIYHLLQKV